MKIGNDGARALLDFMLPRMPLLTTLGYAPRPIHTYTRPLSFCACVSKRMRVCVCACVWIGCVYQSNLPMRA
jgi:hypothetical protein